MTGPRGDTPSRRASDQNARGRVRAWWQKWGQLVIGGTVLVIAVATFAIGLEVRSYSRARAEDAAIVRVIAQQQAAQQKATAAAAKTSCMRSRNLGPQLADYYALDPKFPREVLAEYRRTIPKTCPK